MPRNEPDKESASAAATKGIPSLYSLTAIGIATFLGSILVGGYMVAANYVALGKRRMATFTIYGSCAVFVVIVLLSSQLPPGINTMVITTISQVIAAIWAADKLQGPMFESYKEMGGTYHSITRSVLIGLVPFFLILVIFSLVGIPQIALQQ